MQRHADPYAGRNAHTHTEPRARARSAAAWQGSRLTNWPLQMSHRSHLSLLIMRWEGANESKFPSVRLRWRSPKLKQVCGRDVIVQILLLIHDEKKHGGESPRPNPRDESSRQQEAAHGTSRRNPYLQTLDLEESQGGQEMKCESKVQALHTVQMLLHHILKARPPELPGGSFSWSHHQNQTPPRRAFCRHTRTIAWARITHFSRIRQKTAAAKRMFLRFFTQRLPQMVLGLPPASCVTSINGSKKDGRTAKKGVQFYLCNTMQSLPSHWKCGRLCFDRRVFIYLFNCMRVILITKKV